MSTHNTTSNGPVDLLYANAGDRFECADFSILVFQGRTVATETAGRIYKLRTEVGNIEVFRFRDGTFQESKQSDGRDIKKRLPVRQTSNINLALYQPGQRFRLRNGSEAVMTRISPSGILRYHIGGVLYRGDGRASIDGGDSGLDVISVVYQRPTEQPPQLPGTSLKEAFIGCLGRRRDGKLTRCTAVNNINNSTYPYSFKCGKETDTYTDKGFFSATGSPHEKDIVALVPVARKTPVSAASAMVGVRQLVASVAKGTKERITPLLDIIERELKQNHA